MRAQLLALVLACGFGSDPPPPPGIPPSQPTIPQACIDACPGAVHVSAFFSPFDRPACQCFCWNGQAASAFSDQESELLVLRRLFAQICPPLLSPD